MKKMLLSGISTALMLLQSWAPVHAQESVETTPQDSLVTDSVPVDSARLERMAYQAELSKEIAAMSRTSLGTKTHAWPERATFETTQGGRTQLQWYWFNPKTKDAPHVWQMQNGATEDVFYLDQSTNRAATLNLTTLQGAFIPARIAEQAGFTGNATQFSPKKSPNWEATARTDTSSTWTFREGDTEIQAVLSNEKNGSRAMAAFNWLRLQPIEPCELPFTAEKYPLISLTKIAGNGQALLQIRVLEWTALETPLEVDATQLSINDPERDLRTIAREWTDEKKAKEATND